MSQATRRENAECEIADEVCRREAVECGEGQGYEASPGETVSAVVQILIERGDLPPNWPDRE